MGVDLHLSTTLNHPNKCTLAVARGLALETETPVLKPSPIFKLSMNFIVTCDATILT